MDLTFDALSKNYGKKQALIGFSAELTGGIYGLLGPNGAGKSTLMNILTGNLRQTAGEIRSNGAEIRSLGAAFRGRVGYMPQQQTLYPGFTAERFLLYMASLRRMPRARALERIDWALGAVGLSDVRGKTIRSLSGGMKQRLLLAQAILDEPDILILDEPTAGLDPRQRIAVRNLIAEIALQEDRDRLDARRAGRGVCGKRAAASVRGAAAAQGLSGRADARAGRAGLGGGACRVRAARRAGRRDGLRHRPRRRRAYPRAPAGGKAAALCLQAACAGAGGCVSALLRRGGRAMSYELRKILGNRYVMLLLALAVAVNARCSTAAVRRTSAASPARTSGRSMPIWTRWSRSMTPCSTESTARTSVSRRCRTRTSGATPC